MNGMIPHPPNDTPEPTDTYHLGEAQRWMDNYEHRINQDGFHGSLEDRQIYEDRAYKMGMLHAAFATAEAATRQAEVAEDMLEFMAGFVDKTQLIDSLIQWSKGRGA